MCHCSVLVIADIVSVYRRCPELLQMVRTSGVFNSGGSPNPLGSQIAEQLMASRQLDKHLALLKDTMCSRSRYFVRACACVLMVVRDSLCRVLCEAVKKLIPMAELLEPEGGASYCQTHITVDLSLRAGYFVWVKLPAGITASALAPLAKQEGVMFCPGHEFAELHT